MPSDGFEPTISAGERPHIYTLDRAAAGIGWSSNKRVKNKGSNPSKEKTSSTEN
jgi:hypothetical protein